jgi:hypothetical protein
MFLQIFLDPCVAVGYYGTVILKLQPEILIRHPDGRN